MTRSAKLFGGRPWRPRSLLLVRRNVVYEQALHNSLCAGVFVLWQHHLPCRDDLGRNVARGGGSYLYSNNIGLKTSPPDYPELMKTTVAEEAP